MKGELIIIGFLFICFVIMGIKYYNERKRYLRCRTSNNLLNKKLKELNKKCS